MTDEYQEDLNFVRKIGPLPMFWGADTDSMDKIEAAGHNDYYITAQEKIALPLEANKVQTYEFKPTIFLVTKTVMGRSIVVPDEKTTDLFQSGTESAEYFMPKMPWEMVQKMDHFFRTVFKKHGTEAILVLVYDPDFFNSPDPSAGWRCIAPKQSNTGGACDYDPSSIQARKKEHEIILGTIHSHPEMSAFFSGTDHKDQDDWDGIHITQAWKGNGPTEYHLAMILGGRDWNLKMNQVFAMPPLPTVVLDEVDEWVENVEKKVYANHQNHHTPGHYTHTTGTSNPSSNPVVSLNVPLPTQNFIPSDKIRAIKLPVGAPDPRENVIIAEYHEVVKQARTGTVNCRMCDHPLLTNSIKARRCLSCSGWMVFDDELVSDLATYRDLNNYQYSLYVDVDKSPHPIVIYKLDESFTEDQRATDFPKV